MSYIEKTARKLFPILTELKKKMVPEKQPKTNQPILGRGSTSGDAEDMLLDLTAEQPTPPPVGVTKNQATDMKNILGYLN